MNRGEFIVSWCMNNLKWIGFDFSEYYVWFDDVIWEIKEENGFMKEFSSRLDFHGVVDGYENVCETV